MSEVVKNKYTPEELGRKVDEYIELIRKMNKGIEDTKLMTPITLSGFCVFAGVYKDYISEKAMDEKFSETIKKLRQITERDVEEGILTGRYNATAGIFNLKNNYGWTDKKEEKKPIKQIKKEAKQFLKDNGVKNRRFLKGEKAVNKAIELGFNI